MSLYVYMIVLTTLAAFVLVPPSKAQPSCQHCVGGQCDSENECSRCQAGYYGRTCEITCSPHCRRAIPYDRHSERPCNKTSGKCDHGCDEDDKVIRYAGDNCTFCINTNCDNPLECGTKECTLCQRGYYGNECRRSCKEYCYTFKDCRGPNCNEADPMCGRHDGSCSFGCIDGIDYCPSRTASKAQRCYVNGVFYLTIVGRVLHVTILEAYMHLP